MEGNQLHSYQVSGKALQEDHIYPSLLRQDGGTQSRTFGLLEVLE